MVPRGAIPTRLAAILQRTPTVARDPGPEAVVAAYREAGELDLLKQLAEALDLHNRMNATPSTRQMHKPAK